MELSKGIRGRTHSAALRVRALLRLRCTLLGAAALFAFCTDIMRRQRSRAVCADLATASGRGRGGPELKVGSKQALPSPPAIRVFPDPNAYVGAKMLLRHDRSFNRTRTRTERSSMSKRRRCPKKQSNKSVASIQEGHEPKVTCLSCSGHQVRGFSLECSGALAICEERGEQAHDLRIGEALNSDGAQLQQESGRARTWLVR
ncbi:unnamed protein product [Rangifer tarandus platyrhynchus]|uniref:Uncharacterized protein n=1 Tax=Rangifer tarandus platyrhynchus TaxID=3082113 RepID=A0ABN8XNT6_RANTA|nr:unnamed protein product [Rangifer tarandus platyrhynchus]